MKFCSQCTVTKINEFFGKFPMQSNLFITGLPLLHEVIACHIAQHALESLLLRGLTLFASAFSMPGHLAQASVWHFRVADSVMLTCPTHIDLGLTFAEIEILC